MRDSAALRVASGSADRASSSRTRSVSIRPGSRPTTRMPRGPSSSARDLAKPASPGRSPLEMVSPGIGSCTEPDSTKPMTPPSPSSAAAARASRTAPRNTDSKAARHCSSVVSATNPGGGPPTLTRMPSRRWNRSRAVATSRAGACGSALSTATPTAFGPSAAAASPTLLSSRPVTTTFAPSATSSRAVAWPSPRVAPVTTYTRSFSPRSMDLSCLLAAEQGEGGVHQTDVTERLRDVAELPFAHRVVLLRQQAHVVGEPQQPLEQLPGLARPAGHVQGVREPERAHQEGGLVAGQPVDRGRRRRRVPAQQPVPPEVRADRLDGAEHPRVVGRQETHPRDEQQGRVELARAVGLGEGVPLGVDALLAPLPVHLVAQLAPAVEVAVEPRVVLQGAHRPVGGHPHHDLRVHEVAPPAAHFPQSLVRLLPHRAQELHQ